MSEAPVYFDESVYTRRVEVALKLRESTCYDVCSWNGLLAAGCDLGYLRLHNIEQSLRAENASQASRHSAVLDIGVASFLSMCSGVVNNTPILIGGGQQSIFGWRWENLFHHYDSVANGSTSQLAEVQPEFGFDCAHFSPNSPVQIAPADINMMAMDENSSLVYAASGTGDVFVCDIDAQRMSGVLSGTYHNSYVHSVSINRTTGLVTSGDEDGCVCVWDTRSKVPVVRYDVKDTVKTTSIGDVKCYVAGAQLDDSGNFLICGGGADTSTGMLSKGQGWMTSLHLKTLTPVASVVTPAPIQELTILPGGDIVTGGTEGCIRYHSFPTLTQTSTTAVSPRSTFSIRPLQASSVTRASEDVVLAVAGSSPYIDVFITRGYKSTSLLPHIPQL